MKSSGLIFYSSGGLLSVKCRNIDRMYLFFMELSQNIVKCIGQKGNKLFTIIVLHLGMFDPLLFYAAFLKFNCLFQNLNESWKMSCHTVTML